MAGLKCQKCDREFKEDEKAHKAFVWEGKAMCEECLFTMGGGFPGEAETWMAFQNRQNADRPPRY